MNKVCSLTGSAALILLIMLSGTGFLYADSIILKSGKTIEGKVISQDDKNCFASIKWEFLPVKLSG